MGFIIYMVAAFIVFFFFYKKKYNNLQNKKNYYDHDLEYLDGWFIWIFPIFWVIFLPLIGLWKLLERITKL